jgi:hypothetical protein
MQKSVMGLLVKKGCHLLLNKIWHLFLLFVSYEPGTALAAAKYRAVLKYSLRKTPRQDETERIT